MLVTFGHFHASLLLAIKGWILALHSQDSASKGIAPKSMATKDRLLRVWVLRDGFWGLAFKGGASKGRVPKG